MNWWHIHPSIHQSHREGIWMRGGRLTRHEIEREREGRKMGVRWKNKFPRIRNNILTPHFAVFHSIRINEMITMLWMIAGSWCTYKHTHTHTQYMKWWHRNICRCVKNNKIAFIHVLFPMKDVFPLTHQTPPAAFHSLTSFGAPSHQQSRKKKIIIRSVKTFCGAPKIGQWWK